DTWFSGEPKQRDRCTDTEEDQLLEKPDTQYSSKVTRYPSIASSIAESRSCPGSDGASSLQGPELVYIPAKPAQLAAHVLPMVSSEAGQLPPHSNVWTFCHLTDLRPGQKSPPSVSPAGAGVPYSQSTLSLPWREGHQCGQLSQVSAPISVMQEESKRRAPPFISVGSNVQNTQDWGNIFLVPGGSLLSWSQVPEETAVKPCTPGVFSVAIPLDDAIPTKKGFPAGAKHPGINALAESYGTTGQITITPGPLARAGS
uniref:Uncharacterized protein n=1 Tax=Falco tinnunculus TaxID=100819 RepID=A0A8C4USW6_FALTI